MRTLRRISVVEANSMTFFKLYFFVWILEYFLTLDMEYLHYHNLPYEQVLLLKVYLKRVELLLLTDMEAERVYWILLGFSKFVLILFKKGYQYQLYRTLKFLIMVSVFFYKTYLKITVEFFFLFLIKRLLLFFTCSRKITSQISCFYQNTEIVK